mgnify:CR=1 FL=1
MIGKRNKNRGKKYELKIIKELKELTGDNDLCSSRSESKKLDDMKKLQVLQAVQRTTGVPYSIRSKIVTPILNKLIDEKVDADTLFNEYQKEI